MKYVFSSHEELCHVWASDSQSEGRATNMSFSGGRLYSYGTVIANRIRHKRKVAYIIDIHSFSSSTSKHQSHAFGAIPEGERVFLVKEGARGQWLAYTPAELRDWYIADSKDDLSESGGKVSQAREAVRQFKSLCLAQEVCEHFGLGTKRVEKLRSERRNEVASAREFLEQHEAKVRARREYEREHATELARKRLAAKIRLVRSKPHKLTTDQLRDWVTNYWDNPVRDYPSVVAKVKAEQLRRCAKAIAAWKNGGTNQIPSGAPTYLRVIGGGKRIETSRRAIIPYESGKRCFRFALARRKKGWERNGETFAIGLYQLDRITETGIVAGCHNIGWDVIEAFAKEEGWIK